MCAAITRWVQYDSNSSGTADDGRNAGCKGTRGYVIGTGAVSDTITINDTSNQLYLTLDGLDSATITLYSGANLDPRFIARDITEKMRNLGKNDARWDNAYCEWSPANNGSVNYGNKFQIYSGSLGSASSVVVASGVNSANTALGFSSTVTVGGTADHSAGPYAFLGTASISGTYHGFVDEIYKIVITNDNQATRGIATPVKGVGNTYGGVMTTGGVFNASTDIVYTINIDTSNGSTMGAGSGNVPIMTWTSTGGIDDSTVGVELLYADTWYKVGSHGLMVKFTDAVFSSASPAWTIFCYKPQYAYGTSLTAPVGTATYVYSSNRGDDSTAPITTVSGGYTQVGNKGLYIKFNPTQSNDYLQAGDEFYIICSAPKPIAYDINSINYGNVTVSTESPVKCVMFEIMSGAVEMSSVRFGLQSHGSFQHHQAGNNDTYFRFGTVGPKNTGSIGPFNAVEWYPGLAASDIDSDIPPSYLYHTKANLQEVSDASSSEPVGSTGLMSDPMFVCIRLGAAEVGSNSTINNRIFFDYS